MKVTQYTIKTNGGDVTINTSDKGQFWRMVHDGVKVLSLFDSSGITRTKNQLFLAETFDACIAEANRLGLSGLDEHNAKYISIQIDELYTGNKIGSETKIDFAVRFFGNAVDLSEVSSAINTVKTALTAQKGGQTVGSTKPI